MWSNGKQSGLGGGGREERECPSSLPSSSVSLEVLVYFSKPISDPVSI